MKYIKLIIITLIMTFGAIIVHAQKEPCRDNVEITVSDLENLPDYGIVYVSFISTHPTQNMSLTMDPESFHNGFFNKRFWGNYTGYWSLVHIRIVIGSGSNVYVAQYYGEQQPHKFDFTADDFHHITTISDEGTIPDPQYAP